MRTHRLLITMAVERELHSAVVAATPESVECQFVDDVDASRRAAAIADADAILSRRPLDELTPEEFDRLHSGQIVQVVSAGVDHLPIPQLPDGLVVLSNAGVYSKPIAEHAVAFYLALSKRFPIEHRKLETGEFDQHEPNRRVEGSTCGIVGYGGIGQATARLLKTLGVSIFAINRSGMAAEPAEFLGTPADLEYVLRQVDGVVLALPLTPETQGLIDEEALGYLSNDAFLINVARGEVVDQRDLFVHLTENPTFQAGIDAWWTEPARHGEFETKYPFLELPNVIGSPHNSAQVPGIGRWRLLRAVENVTTALTQGVMKNEVNRERGY